MNVLKAAYSRSTQQPTPMARITPTMNPCLHSALGTCSSLHFVVVEPLGCDVSRKRRPASSRPFLSRLRKLKPSNM